MHKLQPRLSPQRGKIFNFFALAAVALGLVIVTSQFTQAQTYTVLYNFTGGTDGGAPMSTLILDSAGNLYGTTKNGGDPACIGNNGTCGVVFKLDPSGTETVLHNFEDVGDGINPEAGVTMDTAGNLYGTTTYGGTGNAGGNGVVFKLAPSGAETVLYAFNGTTNFAGGGMPAGNVVLDAAGNIYGATSEGGYGLKSCRPFGCGLIYKLSPSGTETVLHKFNDATNDGSRPDAGPVMDAAGNIYFTTTVSANNGPGAAFRLTPSGKLSVLEFPAGTGKPSAPGGITFNSTGTAYIPMLSGGSINGGGIQKVSAAGKPAGFATCDGTNCYNPNTGMVFDAAENLYGTSLADGTESGGTVFKLDTTGNLTAIHDFSINDMNGHYPMGGLVMDSAGNLYGTTSAGGAFNWGVVFKITP